MKYNFFINQEAIARAGFIGKTDVSDWMILEYIKAWEDTKIGLRHGSKIWINYQHLIDEIPILGIGTKSTISRRINKLAELGLLSLFRDLADHKVYAETTAYYAKVLYSKEVSEGVALNERPVALNERPVALNEPIHTSDNNKSIFIHQMQSTAAKPAATAKDEKHNQSLIDQVMSWYKSEGYEEDINLHFKFFIKRLATFQTMPRDVAGLFKRAITDDWAALRKPDVPCDIPEWARMPKDHKQLWPWLQQHGYPKSLGQVYETDLRKVLKREVDLRMDLFLDHGRDMYCEQRRPEKMRT